MSWDGDSWKDGYDARDHNRARTEQESEPVMDFLHRIFSGQTLTARELRIAGWVVLIWFLMDAVEWSDWLFRWRWWAAE